MDMIGRALLGGCLNLVWKDKNIKVYKGEERDPNLVRFEDGSWVVCDKSDPNSLKVLGWFCGSGVLAIKATPPCDPNLFTESKQLSSMPVTVRWDGDKELREVNDYDELVFADGTTIELRRHHNVPGVEFVYGGDGLLLIERPFSEDDSGSMAEHETADWESSLDRFFAALSGCR